MQHKATLRVRRMTSSKNAWAFTYLPIVQSFCPKVLLFVMNWEKRKNSLCNVTWRHDIILWLHMYHHTIGHNDFTCDSLQSKAWKSHLLTLWRWPWPIALTYNPTLAKVKVKSHTQNQGNRSKSSAMGVPTDRQTHTQLHKWLWFYDLHRWWSWWSSIPLLILLHLTCWKWLIHENTSWLCVVINTLSTDPS